MSEAEIEKKIGLSLDELIAQQKAKQANKPKPKPKAAAAAAGGKKKGGTARVQKVQTKTGGRVLVVPRPKHVPRPSGNLKATRGGGVHKGGAAPKYGGSGGGARQVASRNVKVTIGNKLSGRPAPHIPTSGVLSKPFLGGSSSGARGGYGGGGYNGGGRAAMQVEGVPAGGSLSSRFDSLAGVPTSGRARPTGEPRRNAHGVILP